MIASVRIGASSEQLGAIDVGLVGQHRALVLFDKRVLRVLRLHGNRILGQQIMLAGQVQLGVAQFGLVAHQRALRLGKRRL